MSGAVIDAVASRIGDHAEAHRLPRVRVILHGGEPLLAGQAQIKRLVAALRRALPPYTTLDLRLQTNGLLLAADEAFCAMLVDSGFKIGVSLDGDRTANDRNRVRANGTGSYEQTRRAIQRLSSPRYRHGFAGLLCTIDLLNDPVSTYVALAELDPPRIDFLLPHGNWDTPPPRPPARLAESYGDWLIAVFERWHEDGRLPPIRIFDSIRSASLGDGTLTEALGTEPSDLVVVETDGAIEQSDALKTAYHGAAATGFTVLNDSFDEAARHPGFDTPRAGKAGLCAKCRTCSVVDICGGGLYAHRYRSSNGFDNPSVHCDSLIKIIKRVSVATVGVVAQPVPFHGFPARDFDALASGLGDARAIAALRVVQLSLAKELLAGVLERARASGAYSRRAWEAIEEVERRAPDAFATVLQHPFLRVWAQRCMAALDGPEEDSREVSYLTWLAIAVAVRAGLDTEVESVVRDGVLVLPSVGVFEFVELTDANVRLIARSRSATVEIGSGLADASRWRAPAVLTSGGDSLALDDCDPYRNCFEWQLEPRVAPAQVRSWRTLFDSAWRTIRSLHDEYAPALSAGLTTVVPLAPVARTQVSATARAAFGAVAIALPTSCDELAMQLIHEFQHVKLGALLDMFELYDSADDRLFDAPWRTDKRPLEALLQGAYAHVAVADVWRARWTRGDLPTGQARMAAARFVYWRDHTAAVLETLAGTGSLSALGTRLVGSLHERVARAPEAPVTPEIQAMARALADRAQADSARCG